MLKLAELVLNLFSSEKFYYFLLRFDTSIGIASESIRLALVKSKIEKMKVTFLRCKVPCGHLIFSSKYPSEIYSSIDSENIRKEFVCVELFLSYYYGIKFLIFSVLLSIVKMKKVLYAQYLYGHENIYFPAVFPRGTYEYGAWARVARSVRAFPSVQLSGNGALLFRRNMVELGIENGWYVCLHIRSSHFYNDNAYYRNGSIENYYRAIDLIINSGGIVVRLGDAVDGFITKPRRNLVDYPNTRYKSEFMDLHLIQNCKFYFGTQSGMIDMALLFKKPVLSVNSIHFSISGAGKYDTTIYKRVYDKSSKRFLSFSEMMSLFGYFSTVSFDEFSSRYEWIENSSQEIYDAAVEIISKIESLGGKSTAMQMAAQRKLKKNTLKRNAISDTNTLPLVLAQAVFSRVIIGRKYLEDLS